MAVNLVFAPHNPYQEKDSAFECGFSSFLGQNRTQFSISFFIFALLFLLFDLEILLVYPYLVSAYTNGVYGLTIMLVFLLALTLGFAFELGKKALSIDSRQILNDSNKQFIPKKDSFYPFSTLSLVPRPHAFISLPVQSQINFVLITRITIFLLAVFFTFALRWPFKTIFVDLDMLAYYPLINTCISLGLAFFVAGVLKKNVSYFRMGFIIAMGMVLPLLVFLITNNLDSVWLSIEALANLYTFTTLAFYPIEPGNFLFSTSSGGNTGSSSGAGNSTGPGIGSSSGAGVGSSSGAGNSTGAGLGSSSAGIPEASIKAAVDTVKKGAMEEAIKRAQSDIGKQCESLRMSDSDTAKVMLDIEQGFRSKFERMKTEEPTTRYDRAIVRAERGLEERLRLEFERINLLDPATRSNPTPFWEKLIRDHSPGRILDMLQGSALSNIDALKEEDQNSVYEEVLAKKVVEYKEYSNNLKLSQRLAKVLGYSNVMSRITVESETLELVKRRNINQSFKSQVDTSRANLDTGKQLISNKLSELKGQLNSKERKMWSKHFKLGEKAYYRPEGLEVNNTTSPRPNQDGDVD